ncbi:acetyl-CoA C-acyltransferase [Georgenia sp. Z1344]|uniref:acetyl-CoA C-acyltransferase n=1 Tax=Georgenia sp. Z1344 TaxID=3416706 RepID=UPI003CFBA0CD
MSAASTVGASGPESTDTRTTTTGAAQGAGASPDDVVVVGAARTPFVRFNGQLATLSAVELGATAIRAAMGQAGVCGEAVDVVLMGQVLQAGAGQNPARQAGLAAGVHPGAHATTINKVCLSSLAAIIDGARLIRLGEAEVVVAGGQESMSQAPHLLGGSRKGWAYGDRTAVDHLAHDGLTDAASGNAMGLDTDRYSAADHPGLTREQQDAVAAASHERAAAAQESGRFDAEIAPVTVTGRKGDTVVDADDGLRAGTTPESLARLRPAFTPEGSITAGNASQISDGAAALVLARRSTAEANGWAALATVRASGQVAGPDSSLHDQPGNAIAAALERQGWGVDDLAHVEINEAFAAVAVASAGVLGLAPDDERINPHGGAISLGHPIGASGARLAAHAVHELVRAGTGRAAVALCGGGGQGDALLLER